MSDHDSSAGPTTGSHDSHGGTVKHAGQIAAEPLKGARETRIQVLVGPDDGAPNFVMRRILMDEEGAGMPPHTNAVEHEQYVLRGRARIGVEDQVYEVEADDVVWIPAGTPHWYEVLEAPFEFICMVPNAPDRVELVDSDDDAR